jgi:hypothetical protein
LPTKRRQTARRPNNEREVEADPSLHDEDIAEQHLSSEAESEVDESPLGLLLAEPRRPKDNPDLPTMREIESLPVLRLFKHHLKDFAGGQENRMLPRTTLDVSVVCFTKFKIPQQM